MRKMFCLLSFSSVFLLVARAAEQTTIAAVEEQGIFARNFGIEGEANADDPMLVHCGADVRPEFAEDKPGIAVVCSTFSDIDPKLSKAKPEDCSLAWISTFVLPTSGTAEIRWQCRGDSDFSAPNIAFADGDKLKGEGWQCERHGEEVHCKNDDGHGFLVGREMQKIF
ncbi:MAG: hypothetical protein Q4A74_07740 [Cardiobacteriaceae bacterium]|nr:hypothetical protein [Cardiobacteriaceae bacterium]